MNIRRNRLLLVITTFALLQTIGANFASAQDQVSLNTRVADSEPVSPKATSPVVQPVTSPLARVGVQAAQPIPLTLNDAIRRALENNTTIEVTRDDVRFQETQIRSILGAYDPTFNISPTFSRNSTTGSQETRGTGATHDFSLNANMTHLVRPGGGNYQVFFNNTRTENAFSQAQLTSGALSSGGTSGTYFSSWGITYRQPLFRNMKIDNTRRNLKIARRRLEQTDADFRRQTIDIIAQVQRTYWDLVFALRDQQNRTANLDLTRENLRQVQARIDAGAAAPLALAEVETELANRESDLLLATQQVSVTENALKQLLLKDASNVEWSYTYLPTDKPVFSLDTISLEGAVKDAMDNRYELRRLKFARDINAIDIAFFKNQTKPQIDLNTTFSFDGLAQGNASTGAFTAPLINTDPAAANFSASAYLYQQMRRFHELDPVPTTTIAGTPAFLVGGFGRSIANTFRSDAPNYQIGVTISFPFRNRTAKANLAGAEITRHQLDVQTRAQEQVVIVEVRNAVQAVETARQRVLTTRRARENAEKQLAGERELFEVGRSTTFLLFQRENALTNARNAEIRAETDYNKALADLQRATSTTFQMNNIEVDSPTDQK